MAQGRAQAPAQIASDLIVALATPPGEGALGIVRLSGPGCLRAASSFLRWAHGPPAPRVAALALAHEGGRPLDRVLATHFPGPGSYTGEDLLEITAHGSPFVLARLLELAVAAGARPAEPGEFTQRAFLNGRMDLTQAEAVCALIRARSRRAHRVALAQLEGGLSRRIGVLRDEALDLLVLLEAALDHPDEGIPELPAEEATSRLVSLRDGTEALLSSYRTGRLAAEGARIALVGQPNAGKSSLLNALLGRERAIVSASPGTTRDTIEESADLGGLAAVLVDTAGLRPGASGPVEEAGMERARGAARSCDLLLVVLDRSRPLGREGRLLLEELARGPGRERPVLAALNKSDLPARLSAGEVPWPSVEVSALRGAGIADLLRRLSQELEGGADAEDSGAVVANLRQRLALEEATRAVERARRDLGAPELCALHLREALAAFGTVLGETVGEEILHRVFSRFCVGK